MPACLTHREFAKKVLAALPESARNEMNEAAFFWGAQGPDFLFCDRYFQKGEKELKSYGSRLHESDPVATLGALRDFLRKHPDPAYRSYAIGFLCHYALDSTAHPYINAKAAELLAGRENETQTTMHGEVEGALDAIMLRRETGKLPSEVNLGDCFPKNEPVQRRIAKIYRELIFRVFGADAEEAELLRCTRDAHRIFRLLTDRTGLKMAVFQRLERKGPHSITSHIVPITERDDVDYANLQNEPWEWKGVSGSENFFELFDRAQTLALTLILPFEILSDDELAELTGRRPFG